MEKKFSAVILAAGQGKRMNSHLPKVMHELAGKSLILRLLETIKETNLFGRPLVVVSPKHDLVQQECGASCDYVIQPEPLGTGQAVAVTEPALKDRADFVCVFYADSPSISSTTVKKIYDLALTSGAAVIAVTAVYESVGPFSFFSEFGRILRNDQGEIIGIREKKDCAPEELNIREVNSGFYCFEARWLWGALRRLERKNVQGEYYLTDLVGLAIKDGRRVEAVQAPPEEAVGINTPEQLAITQKFLNLKSKT